jgi:hypothetical protein
MRKFPEWRDVSPERLLEFQENANGRGRYRLLDLIEKFVREKGGTRNTMRLRCNVLRSFFLHNRCELPRDKFDVGPGTREPVRGNLDVSKIRRIIEVAKIRDRAIFLTIRMGLMDVQRFTYFNEKCGYALYQHIQQKGVEKPFRVDFPSGRKKNYQAYYTFIGHDALEAWRTYFEKERGPVKKNEPLIFGQGSKGPIQKDSIRVLFQSLTQRAGLRGKQDRGRLGINLHEFRDVGRSYLQLAKGEGLDETCAEFWMGHKIDPLGYNKFTQLSPGYVEKNYQIAEKYLNILSGPIMTNEVNEKTITQLLQNNPRLYSIMAKEFFKDREAVREFFGRLADEGLIISAAKPQQAPLARETA